MATQDWIALITISTLVTAIIFFVGSMIYLGKQSDKKEEEAFKNYLKNKKENEL